MTTVYNLDGDISFWDVSNIENMSEMFYKAESFNQNLSNWNVDNVSICDNFSTNAINWQKGKPIFKKCNPF